MYYFQKKITMDINKLIKYEITLCPRQRRINKRTYTGSFIRVKYHQLLNPIAVMNT